LLISSFSLTPMGVMSISPSLIIIILKQ
jgi:hypothetical protein